MRRDLLELQEVRLSLQSSTCFCPDVDACLGWYEGLRESWVHFMSKHLRFSTHQDLGKSVYKD